MSSKTKQAINFPYTIHIYATYISLESIASKCNCSSIFWTCH